MCVAGFRLAHLNRYVALMSPMFTLLHFLSIIGIVAGLFGGIYIGHNYFGWIGGIGGSLLGACLGYILFGYVPLMLTNALMRREFKRSDVITLKERLKTEYYISHLIIGELVARGEPVADFLDYIFTLLQSDDSDKRRFGWHNLNIWFPELAGQFGTFDAANPTAENKAKLASLRRAT